MTIPSAKYLKKKAANRLASGRDPRKVVLVYAAITLVTALLVTGVRFALSEQIAQTGGLQNIGIRSVLSTADTILPIAQTLLLMCLEVGYAAAMLRIVRHQYASPMTLKAGAERFWPVLRSRLMQTFIYLGIAMGGFYLSVAVFFFSPFSGSFMEALAPMVQEGAVDPQLLLDNPDLLDLLAGHMLPMFIIYGIVLLLLCLPVFYRYRFVNYILVDHPEAGAFFALRQSALLMRRNAIAMLRIDLSFWWYYLLQALAAVIAYSDLLLVMLGIQLPLSVTAAYFISFGLYTAVEFGILYAFCNRVNAVYALAYDSLLPKTQPQGVVLGSIFQA